MRDLARLRLAAIQFDEGSNADALGTLAIDPVAELLGAFADLRGDVLVADGKLDEARAAYRKALEAMKSDPALAATMTDVVQTKLEALGGGQS